MIKRKPVIFLARFSNADSFLYVFPMRFAENARIKEIPRTGIAVPTPKSAGIRKGELFFMASENMLPKNSPADTGQNERANDRAVEGLEDQGLHSRARPKLRPPPLLRP